MNRRIQLLPVALWLLILPMANAQTPVWTQFANSPSSTTRHDDIYMLNSSTGWTARGRGGIFKTTDGGQTWVQKLNKTDTHFRCISFLNASHGFAGNLGPGSYDASVTETNVLFETFDGGETWTNHPGFVEQGMLGVCTFNVLDSQTISAGGRVRGPAYFIRSTDGGTNWSVTNLTAAGIMGGIMDTYFKDATNGFVVGMDTGTFAVSCGSTYYGRIARTTNGGASWFPVATTTIPCCYFWKMSWPSPQVGYVSLQQNVTSDTNLNNTLIYYKTTDGGVTWTSNGVPYAAISPTIVTSVDGFIGRVSGSSLRTKGGRAVPRWQRHIISSTRRTAARPGLRKATTIPRASIASASLARHSRSLPDKSCTCSKFRCS